MSTNHRFATLDVDDLRSPTFYEEPDYSFAAQRTDEDETGVIESATYDRVNIDESNIDTLLAENQRLSKENAALRQCLVLTKEQGDLKTANYIASALSWCDNNLKKYTAGMLLLRDKSNIRPESSRAPPSAFKPVSTKPTLSYPTRHSPRKSLFAEDWVERNSLSTSHPHPHNVSYTKAPLKERTQSPPRPSSQPWHKTLRHYDSPSASNSPRPKSAIGNRVTNYSSGGTYKNSYKAKGSGIPVPLKKTTTFGQKIDPPAQWEFASSVTKKRSSPERTTRSRSRTPSPVGRHSPPPSTRRSPSPTGVRSPASSSKRSSSPTGRRTPSPERTSRAPSPNERSSSPSARRQPIPYPTERQTESQRMPFGSPREPVVVRNVRSPAELDSVSSRPVKYQQRPASAIGTRTSPVQMKNLRQASQSIPHTSLVRRDTSPPRPSSARHFSTSPPRAAAPNATRSVSPWSMVSGMFSPTGQRSRSNSPSARARSASPLDAGRRIQSVPRTLGRDPLIHFDNTPDDINIDHWGVDNNRRSRTPLAESRAESTSEYLTSEGYGSRSSQSGPSGNTEQYEPPVTNRQYELIGQPVARSTPVLPYKQLPATSKAKRNESPVASTRIHEPRAFRTGRYQPVGGTEERYEPNAEDSLAELLGMKGQGAGEKARGVVYRAVDSLTGYQPQVTPEIKTSLSGVKHNRRIVGELAFQLDRRILEYIFSANRKKKKNARYYGYSLTNITQMIHKESTKEGFLNSQTDFTLRTRLETILRKLSPFGYVLDLHAEKSQDMVNKYGLLNGPPDPTTVEGFGLNDPAVLRIILSQVLRDENDLYDMLIMLDCLCYLSYEDGQPIFMW